MCGISCILALDGRSHHAHTSHTNGTNGTHQVNGDTTAASHKNHARKQILHDLDKSLDLIKHRGPDSRGHWLSKDNRVGTLVNIPQPSPASPFPSVRQRVSSTDKTSQPSVMYV